MVVVQPADHGPRDDAGATVEHNLYVPVRKPMPVVKWKQRNPLDPMLHLIGDSNTRSIAPVEVNFAYLFPSPKSIDVYGRGSVMQAR